MTGPDPRRQTLIPGQRTVGDAVAARRSRLVQAEQYIAGRWTRVTRVMSLPSEERQELVAIARWIEDGGPRPWEDTPATGEQPYPPIGPGEKVDPL